MLKYLMQYFGSNHFQQEIDNLQIERCAALPSNAKRRVEGLKIHKNELDFYDFGGVYRAATNELEIIFCKLHFRLSSNERRDNSMTYLLIAVITIPGMQAPSLQIFPRRSITQWLENGLHELTLCRWNGFANKVRRLRQLMLGGIVTPNDAVFSRNHCLLGEDKDSIIAYLELPRMRSLASATARRMELQGDTVLIVFDYTTLERAGVKSMLSEAFSLAGILRSNNQR